MRLSAPQDGARAKLLGAAKDQTERVRDADRTFHRETCARASEVAPGAADDRAIFPSNAMRAVLADIGEPALDPWTDIMLTEMRDWFQPHGRHISPDGR
jgi:hypothetical protein